ncbi:hypothetical protein NE237_025506 [Protea cynaroides]|uniref:Uncharacterized protein n=1 Tax=Protea cynaroides TaxID=273540 RepID=A0A9Q0H366_9MAGN|nr:hypothetical protein NE237_025506 [Protea cynaroides]
MPIVNQIYRSSELKLKNVAIIGLTFAMIFNFIDNKYDGKGGDLFSNHKVSIICSMYLMLVAGYVSTAIKLHHGLLPALAELVLSRTSIVCVFEALFMMSSIVLFDKDPPHAWLALCILPVFFLPNPLKQLREWGWFCFHCLRPDFEGGFLLRIRGNLQGFDGLLRNLFFVGRDEQSNETNRLPV